jgi:hypothetical protein
MKLQNLKKIENLKFQDIREFIAIEMLIDLRLLHMILDTEQI